MKVLLAVLFLSSPPLPWPLLPCSAQTSKEAHGQGGCGAFGKAAWVHAMLIHSFIHELHGAWNGGCIEQRAGRHEEVDWWRVGLVGG